MKQKERSLGERNTLRHERQETTSCPHFTHFTTVGKDGRPVLREKCGTEKTILQRSHSKKLKKRGGALASIMLVVFRVMSD